MLYNIYIVTKTGYKELIQSKATPEDLYNTVMYYNKTGTEIAIETIDFKSEY